MKTVVNLNEEQRKFINDLLKETQKEFREAFLEMAKSDVKKDRRRFVGHYLTLTELLLQKRVNVNTDIDPCKQECLSENEKGGQL